MKTNFKKTAALVLAICMTIICTVNSIQPVFAAAYKKTVTAKISLKKVEDVMMSNQYELVLKVKKDTPVTVTIQATDGKSTNLRIISQKASELYLNSGEKKKISGEMELKKGENKFYISSGTLEGINAKVTIKAKKAVLKKTALNYIP